MAITFFNWNELLLYSRHDLAGIICLAYGQTQEYNELSTKTLISRLSIHHIPVSLFRTGLFEQTKTRLICKYKTKEPQSFFKNSAFLYYGLPTRTKVLYLRALSRRKPSDIKNFIPLSYLPDAQSSPLLEIKDDKIYFLPESSI